ncbi:MAG: hypothetical protein OEY70_18650 [Acidimicrobiia bacterium]|nr:hypothetical protein [Acidimicrobiia bacterium]
MHIDITTVTPRTPQRPVRHRVAGRTAALATALLATAGCASSITGGGTNADGTLTTAPTTAASSTVASGATPGSSTTVAAGGTASGDIANLPAGWKAVTGDGASIGVPSGWVDVKPLVNDPAQRAAFEQSIQDQSTSAYIDSIAPALLDQINIFVMDAATAGSGFTTTANVIVDGSGLVTDLDTIETIVPSQLQQVGGTVSAQNRALVGGLETLVVDYTLTTATGVQATGRQYHQLNGNSVITSTFTATPTYVDLALWDQMAATVTLGGGA